MRPRPQIPAEIEEFRDERWRREATRQVETALDAERFIEQVGFAACLTDARRPQTATYSDAPGRRESVRQAAKPTCSMKRSASNAVSTDRVPSRHQRASR